jgi:hypothetical protein
MSLAGQMNPPGRQREKLPQKAAEFVINPALIGSRREPREPELSLYGRQKERGKSRIQESGFGIQGVFLWFFPES